MVENFRYVNNLGEIVEFGNIRLLCNYNDLRDYSWRYDSDFDKISNFNRTGINTKSIPVIVNSEELKNDLFEKFEVDVLQGKPGRIYIGDYYLSCYVVESSKSDYLANKTLLKLDLTIATDTNRWVREINFNFYKNQLISGHGYPYGYPYDYSSSGAFKTLNNSSIEASDFKLTIYGAVENPALYIGDHLYKVNCVLNSGEILEIDSATKSIVKVQIDGTRINQFSYRERSSYIFEKISRGVQNVSWNNEFGFDVTIYDERSEPKWI